MLLPSVPKFLYPQELIIQGGWEGTGTWLPHEATGSCLLDLTCQTHVLDAALGCPSRSPCLWLSFSLIWRLFSTSQSSELPTQFLIFLQDSTEVPHPFSATLSLLCIALSSHINFNCCFYYLPSFRPGRSLMIKDDLLLIWVTPTLRKIPLTHIYCSIGDWCKNGAISQATPTALFVQRRERWTHLMDRTFMEEVVCMLGLKG